MSIYVSTPLCRLGVGALLLCTVSANASTIATPDLVERRGMPIAQSFLDKHGDNVSFVATRSGVSCVASQPIAIADSVYVSPTGALVPFSEITRSPASSVQAIAQPDGAVAFRVQLKYSPDPQKPMLLVINGAPVDVGDSLELSTDSLLLTGDRAAALEDAFLLGEAVTFTATSNVAADGTGRQVTDTIIAPDMAGLAACLVTLEELLDAEELPDFAMADLEFPELEAQEAEVQGNSLRDINFMDSIIAGFDPYGSIMPDDGGVMAQVDSDPSEPALPIPVTGLRVELTARPDPESRIDPSVLASCRMRDIPENVYLGRLRAVTGFFSQTQDVYVAFDDEGQLQRAYVPGIFDSDLTNGVNTARVSLAADSNLPDQPNTVRGCLGDALLEAPVCAFTREGEDGFVVAECGVLGMSETREDFLASVLDLPAVGDFPANTNIGTRIVPNSSGRSSGFSSFGGGGTGGGRVPRFGEDEPSEIGIGGSGGSGDTGGGGGGGGPDIPAIPLPAALWLMLGGMAALFGLKARRNLIMRG